MSSGENQSDILSLRDEIKRLRKALTDLAPPLSALLRRRGFKIYRKEPPGDLLVPDKPHIDAYYRYLQRYSFRLFLRDAIKHQEAFTIREVARYATIEVTGEYTDFLLSLGMAEKRGESFSLVKRPVKSFGPTLEWFLSEVFKREFSAEATWGIKFKRPVIGGDYDLIAKIDSSILYMEIKSSPPKQIYAKEIAAYIDRVSDLSPEISLFFMDTELRMKDKIVPMFEEEFRRRPSPALPSASGPERATVKRLEKELFQIENKIFIINAKDSIIHNIEKVLSWYFRRLREF